MSVPALRQPKFVTSQREPEIPKKTILPAVAYVILTLKNNQKLVVSTDAYNGIITMGNMYKCVFCSAEMKLDSLCKEKHITSSSHIAVLRNYPHVEEYSQNLIRELSKESSFCTICNVVIRNIDLMRHLTVNVHTQELQKAAIRATTYEPSS